MPFPYRTYGTYWIIKPFLYTSPYFVMAAIATIAGIAMAYFEFKRRRLPKKHLVWLSVIIYIFMGIVARLFYFLGPWSWEKYPTWTERIINIISLKSGMVFYGGLIGAILGIFLYTKIKRLDFWSYADAWAPSGGIILFFARIGCFFTGCCYGVASTLNLPWLIQTKVSIIHPTQLYSSLFGLLLFVIATELKYRQAIKKMFKGYVILWGIMIYSTGRFFIEILRDYNLRFFGLSASQLISIGLFALCSVLLLKKYKAYNSSYKKKRGAPKDL